MQDYRANASRTPLDLGGEGVATARWEVYPIWPVDQRGVCRCRKGQLCASPGKHPATLHGILDASSDPEWIAAMFARVPGANLGLRTGRNSGVVVLDEDTWEPASGATEGSLFNSPGRSAPF